MVRWRQRMKKYWWVGIAGLSVVSTLVVWIIVGQKRVWENFDGLYYVVVAKTWYDKTAIANLFSFPLPLEYYPAHFPLYPALIWLTANTGLVTHPSAMLVVNLIASAVVAVGMVWLAKQYQWGKEPVWFGIAWLFWWPRMWAVRSVGSPEILFIGLVIASLYFFDAKKYWWSAIAGSLAMLTKSPGILLFVAYGLLFRKKSWPVVLIPITLVTLFGFYYVRTGDFWAYFHSGDNIHLQALPFKVFDASQPWVGTWWLEEIMWIYLVGGIGVYKAWQKNRVWGTFGAIFLASIMFVSHRDVSRYALPLVPVVLFGLAELLDKRAVRVALVLATIPALAYTVNFMMYNFAPVPNWGPLL